MQEAACSRFDSRSQPGQAGYNSSSLELARRRLKSNPGMRLEVSGFFSTTAANGWHGADAKSSLIGNLTDLGTYVVLSFIAPTSSFSRCPSANSQVVMDLLDDLRDTTASIYSRA
jgi:hypothetical protein